MSISVSVVFAGIISLVLVEHAISTINIIVTPPGAVNEQARTQSSNYSILAITADVTDVCLILLKVVAVT